MEYSKIIADAKDRFSNPRSQNFSIPWDVMKYIHKEWSLVVYVKLKRTCKYFYASQPWMVVKISKSYSKFRKFLNKALEKNLKIWVVGTKDAILDINSLTSEDKFSQLLHSVRFSSLENLKIENRKLSYSDYIKITESKSLEYISLGDINVTAENDENQICLLDDLIKPLKSIERFRFGSENGNNYYFESAKRLANFTVPKNLYELIICEIPEYISFEYFYLFLKKNSSITLLGLDFKTADTNNTFINDVQSFYFEDLTYKIIDFNSRINFQIFIGNSKISAYFYKICKMCNQALINKMLHKELCPLYIEHWICEACHNAFRRGGPCSFCLAGI